MVQDMTLEAGEVERRDVCDWRHVKVFDNFLRPLIHNPRKLLGPHVREGMTVLDVGCGRGFAALGLARLVGPSGRVLAADLQPQMLDMVRARAARAGLSERIELVRCSPDRIGLDRPVDFALAFWMVHEVPDGRTFLLEIHDRLAPGGRFLLIEPLFHVSRKAFEETLRRGVEAGFTLLDRPRVRFSRAAVLGK
jgi:ubiquinone/menaquinone biosynthesis C-methylase UbiE